MGEVRVKVLLRNYASAEMSRRGYISQKEIESSELEMLVDTGAVLILLPQDEVEKLGLHPARKIVVTYADERKEERWLAMGLEVNIGNRSMVTDCIVGPPPV
ncbi:retroviral-like aspartic protease family protein [Candidatus Magnetobacterium casense]|uniref:Aspartyl protease family protein n=1 Tax=Candidatus Magnetobacterium casense TaxID=1455061 RepID=A0ABS6RWS1_9BACT|nr:retroviral-like aspartic protease family protein [Candidatus Magnetobacterium casensis]MBV6341075.1 aspartyl protease family protein [Candidatus Magnetobacterium casensis]